ncbi:hypothetical protein NM208_g16228 [Fusarium decemcellulare]|uniref:Uncharacterized protein n=1 Tax=Fusarium decemcellulare TaxID=57161 RepID=A0ACC1RC66_9HYPO|nr:hypothetical protein NM208_g16228 [Fusarium decemcellulare]
MTKQCKAPASDTTQLPAQAALPAPDLAHWRINSAPVAPFLPDGQRQPKTGFWVWGAGGLLLGTVPELGLGCKPGVQCLTATHQLDMPMLVMVLWPGLDSFGPWLHQAKADVDLTTACAFVLYTRSVPSGADDGRLYFCSRPLI